MKLRQDYFGRAVGNLSRSLRAIKRYEDSFEPEVIEKLEIFRATADVEKAMAHLEEVNRLAREREADRAMTRLAV